ncbi:MAG: TadE family type IV pilus minor pilin [Candidatus Nanopelagicales bacterium]|nr:TadE family type IV pilus minor pilin [Candidatus Nanopelagicales bacterium]
MDRANRPGRRYAGPAITPDVGASPRAHAQVRGESGFAVLETALAIPVLVAVTVLLLVAINAGMLGLQLTDRAHDFARALARGAPTAEIQQRAARELPDAMLTLDRGDAWVSVTLAQQIAVPIPAFDSLSMTLERTATTALELQ